MQVDLTTWAGVAAATTLVVSLAARFVPAVKDREALLAIFVGVLLAAISKYSGIGFREEPWPQLILTALLIIGPSAGVVKDKFVNPLLGVGNGVSAKVQNLIDQS